MRKNNIMSNIQDRDTKLADLAIVQANEDRRNYNLKDDEALSDFCCIVHLRYEENIGQPVDPNISLATIAAMPNAEQAVQTLQALWEKMQQRYPLLYSKTFLTTKCPAVLHARVRDVASIDFTKVKHDIIGSAFEKWEAEFFRGGRLGQHFSPDFLTETLVKVVSFFHLQDGGLLQAPYTMYDICGGAGGICKMFRRTYPKADINAVEIANWVARFAAINFIFAGASPNRVSVDDSLTMPLGQGSCDFVLTNPPWSVDVQSDKKIYFVAPWLQSDRKDISEFYFAQRAIQITRPGGYIGLVLPTGFANTKPNIELRKLILRECELLAAIEFPKNSFTNTGIAPIILVLRRKQEGKLQTASVFMYKIDHVGMRLNRKSRDLGGPDDRPQMLAALRATTPDPLYWKSIGEVIEDSEARFDPGYYMQKKLHGIPLGEVCNIEKSITIPSRQYLDIDLPGSIFYIRDSDLEGGYISLAEDTIKIAPNDKVVILQPGQILICARGNGRTSYVDDSWSNIKATCPPYILILTLKSEKFLPRFVAYVLDQKYLEYASGIARGSIQPTLTEDDIKKFPIPDLSLENQKKIVNQLEEMEKLRREIEERKQITSKFFETKL